MHMANELLSVPVASGGIIFAAGGLWAICKKAAKNITADKMALMGIMGAFVFAAQMVNFQLPLMPGTSGHMVGAVLLAIILGPNSAVIVMAAVVIIQCLIFQDGGLLALGFNIINMAIAPSYLGYYVYRLVVKSFQQGWKVYPAAIIACLTAAVGGAVLVPIEVALSGVLLVPFHTFLMTMVGVHILIGLVEGIITAAVLVYLRQVRPDIIASDIDGGKNRFSRKTVLASFCFFTIVIEGGISLFASSFPDGLEWSYKERPNEPDFKTIVENKSSAVEAADELQTKYSPMPDYSKRTQSLGQAASENTESADVSAAWTSFAGVLGSVITMIAVWGITTVAVKSKRQKNFGF